MKFVLLAFVAIGYLVQLIQSAVIGVDFGTDFFKISLIAPGKQFVIVESMSSQRKTNSAISFVQNKRFYESDAVNKKTRFPSNSFAFVKDFLGALENNQEVFKTSLSNYDEYILSFNQNRKGTVQFELTNFQFDQTEDDEEQIIILSVEEVIGQIFKYAKTLSEKMANSEVKDCVVTVPTHWNFAQRTALVDAVQLSGLSVLNLISENTAAGLYYGIDRVDNESPHLVLFYNLGANNLQASLIQYDAVPSSKKTGNSTKYVEQITVLADYSIPNVGGFYYDKVIANYFAEQIDNKPERQGKPSLTTSAKVMRKLIRESVKTKEVLSANKLAYYSSIGLYDGNDFSGSISRQDFEDRSQYLFDQLIIPIQKCLERSGKNITDINVVELIGGGTRIPKIQQILQEYFGSVELGTHMNGDESMALGASYHGANFSGSFRVRDIFLNDGYNYLVKAEITNLDEEIKEGHPDYIHKSFTLFPYKQRFGSKKTVSFQTKENLQIKLFTVDYDGNETPYAIYTLPDVEKVKRDKHYTENTPAKISLEFEVSSYEGFYLNEVVGKFNYTIKDILSEKDLRKLEKDRVRKEKKQEKEREKAESEGLTYEPEENLEEMFKVYTEKDGENTISYQFKQKQRTVDLKFNEQLLFFQPLNKTEFKKSQRLIKRFDLYEERQRNLSNVKNQFEAFIYEIRDLVQDETFIKYAQELELSNLAQLHQDNYQWLDSDEAFNGDYNVFNNKLKEMQKIAYPILRRQDEAKYRPDLIELTYQELAKIQNKTQQLEKEHSWLNQTDLSSLKALLAEAYEWVNTNVKLQENKPINEDPVFSVTQLKPMIDSLLAEYNRVRLIRPPKKESDKKSSSHSKTKSGKQKINIDGETIEIDFDDFNKKNKNSDFDFEKFREQFERQQKQQGEKQQKQENENSRDDNDDDDYYYKEEKLQNQEENINLTNDETEQQQEQQQQQQKKDQQTQQNQEDHDPSVKQDL